MKVKKRTKKEKEQKKKKKKKKSVKMKKMMITTKNRSMLEFMWCRKTTNNRLAMVIKHHLETFTNIIIGV